MRRAWQRLQTLWTPRGRAEFRFAILWRVGRWLYPEYRFEWPHLDWWHDDNFNRYLVRFGERDGFNTGRRWAVYELTRLATRVPGDTAECGVFKGAGSYLIGKALLGTKDLPRRHFVFDSFEGLSAPSAEDGAAWKQGDMTFGMDGVRQALASLPDVRLCKGWIPAPFAEAEQARFAFVHIDVDLHDPTHDSMAFFYPRMNAGGILVCDDYGFTTCPGATQAVDEYLADKPERMIALPAGGGFLIKGCATGEARPLA
jgi:O-methyltransferase